MSNKTKKQLILHIPYVMMGLITTNLGEAWRLAEGTNASEKILSLITTIQTAFANPLPSFHPFDLLIGSRMCSDLPDRCLYERKERQEIQA